MARGFTDMFPGTEPILFGRSREGRNLEEYVWGDKDKSIVFLSGFASADRPLSETLIRWKNHLTEGEAYGGILGDFDLKTLKNRCRIRVIPFLNPDSCETNRSGISEKPKNSEDHGHDTKDEEFFQTNSRGVNLNRNFNADWLSLHRSDPRRSDCGPFPESEAEVQAFTLRIRNEPPASSVILRHGQNALYYPEQATPKEIREAIFLGQYSSLPVRRAENTAGTALQWLTDKGIKAIEIRLSDASAERYVKLQNLLTMCAALT